MFLLILIIYTQQAISQPFSSQQTLFQHRFFSLSQDASLLCQTSLTGFFSTKKLYEVIYFYEYKRPELRAQSVAVLTDHYHPDHLEDLQDYRDECAISKEPDFCLLQKYWGSRESALRALALFYDTKTVIKHGEDYKARRFSEDHLRVFEKAIRKIPVFLRKSISKAKPINNLDKVIEDVNPNVQTLIHEAFPEDYSTSVWKDDTHPLTLVPGFGFRSQVVAQVYSGQNLIIVTVKAFDKAKEEKNYKDIDLKYLVDFRLPIIIHEIAHTIDNFHFWNGKDELYFFYRYRKMSTDWDTIQMIKEAKLALWPSKWFEAFESLWEVNEGRYDGRIQEKLAELLAQYILIPERLKKTAPEGYTWLRDDVFKGVEYAGYDTCTSPIVRPLNGLEWFFGKVLGR